MLAASSEGFDAAVREGLARANKTLRGITGLIEHKASVENEKIEEYRVIIEVTFILENKRALTKTGWCSAGAQLVLRAIHTIHTRFSGPCGPRVTSKICHTGEGRCLWRKWVPACAGKDEEGEAAVNHLIASEH
jgi:flavin-binding protein dodecin